MPLHICIFLYLFVTLFVKKTMTSMIAKKKVLLRFCVIVDDE